MVPPMLRASVPHRRRAWRPRSGARCRPVRALCASAPPPAPPVLRDATLAVELHRGTAMWEEPSYEIIDTGLEVTAYLSTDAAEEQES
jgi:coenzyme PQQ precursor peptide PqqA